MTFTGWLRSLVYATSADPFQLRDLAVGLVRQAGDLLRRERSSELQPGTKSTPTDLVTVMDHKAERLIVEALEGQRPDDTILAEEGSSRQGNTGVRWIIDPLDGTVNYFYGIPAYGVSIAAEVDGTIVAGAVYDGMHGAVHEAVLGHGARSNDIPLRCSNASTLAVSLIGTGFAYSAARRAKQGDLIAGLLPAVRDLRRIGAAALDLCAVAGGHLDGFFEHGLQPWDRAAGLLIAAEAGARTARIMDGDEELTMAAAPGIFDELREALGAAQ